MLVLSKTKRETNQNFRIEAKVAVVSFVDYLQVENRFDIVFALHLVVLVIEDAYVVLDIQNDGMGIDELEEVRVGFPVDRDEDYVEKIYFVQIKKKVATNTRILG